MWTTGKTKAKFYVDHFYPQSFELCISIYPWPKQVSGNKAMRLYVVICPASNLMTNFNIESWIYTKKDNFIHSDVFHRLCNNEL